MSSTWNATGSACARNSWPNAPGLHDRECQVAGLVLARRHVAVALDERQAEHGAVEVAGGFDGSFAGSVTKSTPVMAGMPGLVWTCSSDYGRGRRLIGTRARGARSNSARSTALALSAIARSKRGGAAPSPGRAAARRAPPRTAGSGRAPGDARRAAQAPRGAVGDADRHGPVHLDHGRGRDPRQLPVEAAICGHRWPALGVAVRRGDPRLQLVRPGAAQAQRAVELRQALGDVPGSQRERSWRERDVAAVGAGARVAPGIGHAASARAARRLRVVGHQLRQQAPRRIASAPSSSRTSRRRRRGVALVEDEVDDGEHAGEPVGDLVVAGHT